MTTRITKAFPVLSLGTSKNQSEKPFVEMKRNEVPKKDKKVKKQEVTSLKN